MVEFALVPVRTALLSIDLQTASSTDRRGGTAVLQRMNRVAAACRTAGILVVVVRHALPSDADPGVLDEIFPGVLGLLDRESATAALHAGLEVDERDVLLEKPHFGAFHGTDLEASCGSAASTP